VDVCALSCTFALYYMESLLKARRAIVSSFGYAKADSEDSSD